MAPRQSIIPSHLHAETVGRPAPQKRSIAAELLSERACSGMQLGNPIGVDGFLQVWQVRRPLTAGG